MFYPMFRSICYDLSRIAEEDTTHRKKCRVLKNLGSPRTKRSPREGLLESVGVQEAEEEAENDADRTP